MPKSKGRRALQAVALTGVLAASSNAFAEDPSSALRGALGQGVAKILGGTNASPWNWRSFARVIVSRGGGRRAYCGGTVIADRWVATAAHCASDVPADAFAIEEGAAAIYGARRLSVDQVEINPSFYLDAHQAPHNDIALLHLTSAARSPAQRLLSRDRVASVVVPGAQSYAAGYGLTLPQPTFGPNVGDVSNRLLEAQLPISEHSACGRLLARALNAPGEALVSPDNLCAGDPVNAAADTCNGDSGGPLTMEVGGQRTQVGIVSWGAGCGQRGTVGVYASVGYFEPWIKQYVPEADFGDRPVSSSPSIASGSNCGLPETVYEGSVDLAIVEGSRPRVGSRIHVRASARYAGRLAVMNVDLATCKIFRVAPQSYAPDLYASEGSAVVFPAPGVAQGIQVNGPAGRNRLYAAILPEGYDLDQLVSGDEHSYSAPNVSAIVGELRRQSRAFGAYDYQIAY